MRVRRNFRPLNNIHTYTVLPEAIKTPKGGSWGYPILRSLLTITHPSQERLATPPGSTSPTVFEQWCGFFCASLEPDNWKCSETGPAVFRPCATRLESLTVFRCHYKGRTFFSVILKTLSVSPAEVKPATSRSADRRSPNWANQQCSLMHFETQLREQQVYSICILFPHGVRFILVAELFGYLASEAN